MRKRLTALTLTAALTDHTHLFTCSSATEAHLACWHFAALDRAI